MECTVDTQRYNTDRTLHDIRNLQGKDGQKYQTDARKIKVELQLG